MTVSSRDRAGLGNHVSANPKGIYDDFLRIRDDRRRAPVHRLVPIFPGWASLRSSGVGSKARSTSAAFCDRILATTFVGNPVAKAAPITSEKSLLIVFGEFAGAGKTTGSSRHSSNFGNPTTRLGCPPQGHPAFSLEHGGWGRPRRDRLERPLQLVRRVPPLSLENRGKNRWPHHHPSQVAPSQLMPTSRTSSVR